MIRLQALHSEFCVNFYLTGKQKWKKYLNSDTNFKTKFGVWIFEFWYAFWYNFGRAQADSRHHISRGGKIHLKIHAKIHNKIHVKIHANQKNTRKNTCKNSRSNWPQNSHFKTPKNSQIFCQEPAAQVMMMAVPLTSSPISLLDDFRSLLNNFSRF